MAINYQNQITAPCDLLDSRGHLIHSGYAVSPLWRYDRGKIKAGWHRIKEWDYYAVLDAEKGYGITLTLADLGYIGIAVLCWLDFKTGTFHQEESLSLLPRGRTGLPQTSESGISCFTGAKLNLTFEVTQNIRQLSFGASGFADEKGNKGLQGKIRLQQDPDMDSVAIATSWKEKPRAFYYNHKINCMPAEGEVMIGGKRYEFSPETSFGVIDWGRGNWTYKNRWYWGSASGTLDGHSFGWNIGYGFSDRRPASENVVFYKGKAHKLDKVAFHLNPRDYMEPWKITSNDQRFEMDFIPILDRSSRFDLKLIKSIQHQVFGHFTGAVTLDDGRVIRVNRFFGFAEDVLNWW